MSFFEKMTPRPRVPIVLALRMYNNAVPYKSSYFGQGFRSDFTAWVLSFVSVVKCSKHRLSCVPAECSDMSAETIA